MAVRLIVRLFGTLSMKVSDYDHKKGIIFNAPEGVTPADLLKDLQVPVSHIGFISNGTSGLQLDSRLEDQMTVHFFSLVSGG